MLEVMNFSVLMTNISFFLHNISKTWRTHQRRSQDFELRWKGPKPQMTPVKTKKKVFTGLGAEFALKIR